MNDNEKIPVIFISVCGAIISLAILFAGGLEKLFTIIGAMFDAFGSMTISIGNFLLLTGKLIVVSGITIGVAYGCLHLVYRLIKLVNSSTALMEEFNKKSNDLLTQLRSEQARHQSRIKYDIEAMQLALNEALRPAQVTPEAARPMAEVSDEGNEEPQDDDVDAEQEEPEFKSAGFNL